MQKLAIFLSLNVIVPLSIGKVAHLFSHLSTQDLLSLYDNISAILKYTHLQNNSLLSYVWTRKEKPLPIKVWHAMSCNRNSYFINVQSKEVYITESVRCGVLQDARH